MLDEETVCLILSKLDTPGDFARCITVCKAKAVSLARPTALSLQHESWSHYDDNYWENTTERAAEEKSRETLKGLSTWQQHGRLDNVQSFWLEDELTDWDEKPNAHRASCPFSHAVILSASLWPLTSCVLYGAFALELALDVLPTVLQRLDLWPESAPATRSSAFNRFSQLQQLSIGNGRPEYEEPDGDPIVQDFLLDCCRPSLNTFCVRKGYCCKLATGGNIGDCLPDVDKLVVHLYGDQSSLQLANSILAMPSLFKLEMRVLSCDRVFQNRQWALTVPRNSRLEQLKLCGPGSLYYPELSLQVDKRTITLDCHQLARVIS